jgi:hypothetical protein
VSTPTTREVHRICESQGQVFDRLTGPARPLRLPVEPFGSRVSVFDVDPVRRRRVDVAAVFDTAIFSALGYRQSQVLPREAAVVAAPAPPGGRIPAM